MALHNESVKTKDQNMKYDFKALLDAISNVRQSPTNYIQEDYNIFKVLDIETKEVLICRFIADLLDPYGSHGLGSKPLELFFQSVLKAEISNPKAVQVILEERTDQNRRVDIAIHVRNEVFPIEVKIWANDQEEQLCHYYKYYFTNQKDKKIYYLTPTGWEPSDQSRGDLSDDNIVLLSFSHEIKAWINKIISNPGQGTERTLMILKQFGEVIDTMCAKSKELHEIQMALNIENGNFELTPSLQAAVLLLNNRDQIMKQIRTNYLMRYLDCGKKYEKVPVERDEIDENALVAILKNDQAVAYACVHTNLYLCCRKIKDNPEWQGWKKGVADKNYWTYISPKGDNKPYNMKEFLEIVEENINIVNCLNDIIN